MAGDTREAVLVAAQAFVDVYLTTRQLATAMSEAEWVRFHLAMDALRAALAAARRDPEPVARRGADKDLLCPDCGHHIHQPGPCGWSFGAGSNERPCPCPCPEPVASADAAWEALGADLFDSGNAGAADICDEHRDAIEAAIRGTAAPLDALRFIEYLWTATGVDPAIHVCDLFGKSDPIYDDIERFHAEYARLASAESEPS